jgi:hypothetical protein
LDLILNFTLNLSLAGEASVLPAVSVALTLNLCLPRLRRRSFFGDAHFLKRPPSRLHSKVEPGSEDVNL